MDDLRSVRERVAALKSNLTRHKDEASVSVLSPSVARRSSPETISKALSSKELSTLKTGKSAKELIPMASTAQRRHTVVGAGATAQRRHTVVGAGAAGGAPPATKAAAPKGAESFAARRKRAKGDFEWRADDLEKYSDKLDKDTAASMGKAEEQIKALTLGLLKCGVEREQMEAGNSRELAELRHKLSSMLHTVAESQAQSFEVLESMVEQRVQDLRGILVAERNAVLRRAPVPEHQKWREGASNNLRVTLQQYDAAMELSRCRVAMQLTQRMNGVHEALLRERAAREEDEAMLQLTLDNMIQNAQRKLATEREERTAMERELLAHIQATLAKYNTPTPQDQSQSQPAGQKTNRSRVG